MISRRNGALDEATAKHARLTVTGVVEHTGLAGRYAVFAIHQLDFAAIRSMSEPGCLRRTRRTDFHEDLAAVIRQRLVKRAVANPIDVAQQDPAHAQRFTRTDHDPATLGVEPHDVQRRAGGNAETASLSDGELNDAGMFTKHIAVQIHDVAGFRRAGLQTLDHLGVVTGRHKTDVLAVVLVGDSQTETAGELACLRLGPLAERKAKYLELLARRAEKKIALVALLLARPIERASPARQGPRSHIVAGRKDSSAELASGDQQVVELDRHIAVDAGHRRFAVDVALGEPVDDGFLEAAFVVEHVVRNANALRNAARIVVILACAARPLAVGRGPMVIKLQRYPNRVLARGLEQGGRDRRVYAARHGNDDASVCRPAVEIEAVGHGVSYHKWRWTNLIARSRAGRFLPPDCIV